MEKEDVVKQREKLYENLDNDTHVIIPSRKQMQTAMGLGMPHFELFEPNTSKNDESSS